VGVVLGTSVSTFTRCGADILIRDGLPFTDIVFLSDSAQLAEKNRTDYAHGLRRWVRWGDRKRPPGVHIMNDDRISEVYKGEIWTGAAQDRARRRVNWMCGQAQGNRVLDLGCSQGIASIILGREGFEVVGIDVQASSINYAQQDLAEESSSTRSRVTFAVGEGSDLGFEDGSFNTILLGEVLEHLVAPNRILKEVTRILRPGGRVVITTPFGVLHHHDHKQTFFARPVMSLIGSWLEVNSAEIEDGYFRIVAVKGGNGVGVPEKVLEDLMDASDAALRSIQESLAVSQKALTANDRDLAKLQRRTADDSRDKAAMNQEIALLTTESARNRDLLSSLEKENAQLTRKAEMIARLRHQLGDQRKSATLFAKKVESQRVRIGHLEDDRWTLRTDLAVARWKLNSLKARKWHRLGAVLSRARRNPMRVFDAWRVIFGKSSLPRRPELLPRPKVDSALEFSSHPFLTLPRNSRSLPVPRRLIPVAMWADDAIVTDFQYEWQIGRVKRSNWLAVVHRDRPKLFVAVGSSVLMTAEDSDEIAEIATGMAERKIPTVYWDTGPEIDSDSGLELAKLFDVVCAAWPQAENHYRRMLGDGRVHRLSFAVQMAIHNPTRVGDRDHRIVALADNLLNWRSDGLDVVLNAAAAAGLEVLADREIPEDAPLNIDLNTTLVTDLVVAPKAFKAGLVGGASELCPPEAYHIAATNTPIVMPPSEAVRSVFDGSVLQPISEREAANMFRALLRSDSMRARQAHSALRTVARHHRTGHRADDILAHAGLNNPMPEQLEPISVVIPTNRPHQLDHLLDSVARQTYPNLELVLVLHGIELDRHEIADKVAARGMPECQVLRVDSDVVLGEVFNRGFDVTRYRRIAKMDDDDYYGAEYLHDLSDAQEFSHADIVGKWAHYAYLESVNAMIYRYGDHEHRYREVLAISTLLLDKSVFESVKFPPLPVGSGSVFLKAAAAEGVISYSADRFNYLYMRYSDPTHHTFPIDDLHLTNAELVCYGLNIDHVTI
jgi:2-polyprenyl-3-methyl-5-hydroxy-6-metoxy-1,4-benzoquinol methylase